MAVKLRVGILFGGKSAEHEVSLQSARNVLAAMDPARFQAVLVGIDKGGAWSRYDPEDFLNHADDPTRIALARPGPQVVLTCAGGAGALLPLTTAAPSVPIAVVFPLLHGSYGEDGAIQGVAKMANLPCVGCDVASSGLCMDKILAKRVLREAGVPVARDRALMAADRSALDTATVIAELGLPLFVKAARQGSSVGVSKVTCGAELLPAVDCAARYDTKILIEECVAGRELETSVLGNAEPRASQPGEVIPRHGFYSYAAKYLDADGAVLEAPARLEPSIAERVRAVAIRAFQALGCAGMARVDSFLTVDGRVLVNEVNTIPGFTKISMYPRLWEVSGIRYPELIERLVNLALERFAVEDGLGCDYTPGADSRTLS